MSFISLLMTIKSLRVPDPGALRLTNRAWALSYLSWRAVFLMVSVSVVLGLRANQIVMFP